MFKAIKRFIQNRFWKEDKTEAVARALRAGRLTEEETETLRKAAGDTSRSVGSPVFHESQNDKLLEMTDSVQQRRQKEIDDLTVDVNGVGVLNLSDKSDEEIRELMDKIVEANSGPTTVLTVNEGDLISPSQAAYDMAEALKGSPLTQQEKDEIDKTLPSILVADFPLDLQTNESCASYHSVTKPNPDGRGDLKSDEYQTRKAQLLERLGAGEEVPPRLFPLGTVTNVTVDPSNGGRNSPEETERRREQLAAHGLMMSGQAGAFTTFNPKLGIQPNAEEADDETYALEGGHVMSQESASMYRMLCDLKHHPSYQTNPARQGLFELLRHLETGEWDPASGKVPQRQRVMKIPNEIQELVDAGANAEEIAKYKLQEVDDPEYGFRHSDFHILTAKTDPAKSVFHSGNALQSEVNHLLAMDPEKFDTDTHTEIELAVKKLGDEIDCRVTKVKVVKARLAPLSKNEASKMSPRRRKKESKKVIQASRGKHRG